MMRLFLISICLSVVYVAQAQKNNQQDLDLSYAEIDSLMMVYYSQGSFDLIFPLLENTIIRVEDEFGTNDSMYVAYWKNLSQMYIISGHPKSQHALEKAVEASLNVFGENSQDYAHSLTNQGQYLVQTGALEQGEEQFSKALNIYNKNNYKKDEVYGVLLNNIGYLMKVKGDFRQAERYFLESIHLLEREIGTDTTFYADRLANIAVIYEESGKYEMAEQLYIECINTYKRNGYEMHPNMSVHLSNLAFLLKKLERNQEAKELLIKAKTLDSLTFGENHIYYAMTLNNLGDAYLTEENHELAASYFTKAYEVAQATGLANDPEFIKAGANLAKTYVKSGKYEEAIALYEELIQIGLQNSYNYIVSYILQDVTLFYNKYVKEKNAMDYALKAIEVDTRLKLSELITDKWVDSLSEYNYLSLKKLNSVLKTLNTIYIIKENATQKSTKELQLISNLALNLLRKIQSNQFSETDKLRVLTDNKIWILRGISHLEKDRVAEAFRLADYNKSVLLLEATKSEKIYRLSNLPDSVVAQKEAYYKERAELTATFIQVSETVKDSLRDELNRLNISIDNFEKKLVKEYPAYGKQKELAENTALAAIQEQLDNNTAFIEYLVSDSLLHIFKITNNEVNWHKEAIASNKLQANIKKFHGILSDYQAAIKSKEDSYQKYTEIAHWMYNKLLAPVLKEGDGIENLIIVTDGELGHLPFESFLVEAAPADANYKNLHYLLKNYNISYNYSATLWKENMKSKRGENNGQLLAVAARYDEQLDSSLTRHRLPTEVWIRDALGPLPAAKEEVEALQARFAGYFAFDTLATERVLREKAGDYAIIHLAMHGLLDEKRPMLSSLALTEDGDSLHDNFWQAHEISKAELNADLVVLSACETGYGRFETGNGIASLARAFMYAGVPSLVVSLWQVNDQSTSIIMQNFYANLAKGMDKAEALRQAKLSYIEEVENPIAAHPAFWSPFILIGDKSPIQLQKKGGTPWGWIAGGGAGLLALLGFVGLRRKPRAA